MMAAVTKITAVSYLNTIPFIYGLRHSGLQDVALTLAPPASCAESYMSGDADVALVPAAVVPSLKNTDIITDYCIGAVRAVRTVVLVGDVAPQRVKRIFVDAHSRTSVQLAAWLADKVWKISPEWYELNDYTDLRSRTSEGDAFLLIGDKVFEHEGEFAFTTDLAEAWQAATSLPFCFAVWVARKGTPYAVLDELERAFTFGMEHIYEAVMESDYADRAGEAYEYLTRNIDFLFDGQKRKALDKFWSSGIKVTPRVNPG